jgi:hypothetical protein
MLSDFVIGAQSGQTLPQYETAMNPDYRQARMAPSVVLD